MIRQEMKKEPQAKRKVQQEASRSAHQEGSSFETEISVLPNYVEYEAEFYHIAQFLPSLQQGKVYSPSSPRMARGMAGA